MSFKYTANTLKKMEQLFEEARYQIRYEKGSFHSGYCILEDRRVAVINKFLNTEGRINALLDILPSLEFDAGELSPEMQKWNQWVRQYASGSPNPSVTQTEIDL